MHDVTDIILQSERDQTPQHCVTFRSAYGCRREAIIYLTTAERELGTNPLPPLPSPLCRLRWTGCLHKARALTYPN